MPVLHQRKRKSRKRNEHDKLKQFLDRAIYVVAILFPLMAIPQVLKIWVERNATGVSLVTWSAFLVLQSFWFAYGIVHKEKPIIISSSLWVIIEVLIVFGAVLYA